MDPQSVAPASRSGPPADTQASGSDGMRAKVENAADQAKSSASTVAGTAQEQVREVASETRAQARGVASDVRDRLTEEAEQQSGRAADLLAKWSDDLAQMADGGDSSTHALARQLSDKGREFADQLRGGSPNDLLDQIRRFARRRPGAFLAGSAAAGFIVGRLGKGLAAAESEPQPSVPPQATPQTRAPVADPAPAAVDPWQGSVPR